MAFFDALSNHSTLRCRANVLGPPSTLSLLFATLLALAVLGTSGLRAQENRTWNEQRWGLGFSMRVANIPFETETRTVSTLVPLIMYEGPRVGGPTQARLLSRMTLSIVPVLPEFAGGV